MLLTLLALGLTATLWLDKALVGNIGSHQVEAFGEILDTAIISLQSYLRLRGCTIFIIDRILIANKPLALCVDISSSQMTLFTITIVKLKGTIQLEIVIRITKAAIAIRIPKDTVVLIRQHKRDTYLCIILEEILVLALHIKLLALVLTQTVESLISRAVKLHLP